MNPIIDPTDFPLSIDPAHPDGTGVSEERAGAFDVAPFPTFTLRRADGTKITVPNHPAEHHVPASMIDRPCQVGIGAVCPHGWRLDKGDRRKDGDGCRVVALDTTHDRSDWRSHPVALRDELMRLAVGATVTVKLDDGRVVATVVRGPPRNLGTPRQPSWLVWLDGFSGGFSLERVRPGDWRWWATMLAAP